MTARAEPGGQVWSAQTYVETARFVADLGQEIFSWADPRAGMRVLDLGCGDGALTQKISATGAAVVAVDASPSMVEATKNLGLNAHLMSGEALTFEAEFDLVFSNAALHWMTNAAAVAACVHRALVPGGRFVAEFGGHLNVAAVASAMRAAAIHFGGNAELAHPWYFPTPEEHGALLTAAGFEVKRISLHPRPTLLQTGMSAWLTLFRQPFFDQFDGPVRQQVMEFVLAVLRPSLCDASGQWTADYVRLRFEAVKP